MSHKKLAASLAVALVMVSNVAVAQAAIAKPTVSVTSPTTNTIQQGTITLEAAASAGTIGVQFRINGVKLGSEDLVAPYTATWDTRYAPKSTGGFTDTFNQPVDYSITAVARNIAGSTTSTAVKVKMHNHALSNTIMVLGDSVTQQAFDPDADGTFNYTASAPTDASRRGVFAHMGWAVPDVQQTVTNYSIYRWPQRLVVALGFNDASPLWGSDGWTAADLERFRVLINTPHPTSCVSLVLPAYLMTPGMNTAWATEVDKARADLTALAATRPNTMLVDWKPVIDAHPEYMSEDGIHLATPGYTPTDNLIAASEDRLNPVDPVAAAARQDFLWAAGAQCTPAL